MKVSECGFLGHFVSAVSLWQGTCGCSKQLTDPAIQRRAAPLHSAVKLPTPPQRLRRHHHLARPACCWHRGPAKQNSFLSFTPSTTASSEAAVSSRRFSPSAGHHLCTSRRDISRFSPHIQVDRIFSWKALNPFFGAQDEGFSEFRSR